MNNKKMAHQQRKQNETFTNLYCTVITVHNVCECYVHKIRTNDGQYIRI